MNKTRTNRQTTPEDSSEAASKGNSLSMHDGIPVWYDCCSCEAEPYWTEAFDKSDDEAGRD